MAKYFEVAITTQMTKEVLKNLIIECLENSNALEEEAIEQLTPMSASRVKTDTCDGFSRPALTASLLKDYRCTNVPWTYTPFLVS